MNNIHKTYRQLLIRFIMDFLKGNLPETIDRIAVEMRPKGFQVSRCCIYKERAMLRYRLMAAMGFGMEEETDETKPLREYLADAVSGRQNKDAILTVCTAGCAGCSGGHIRVSDACTGCFARPCTTICSSRSISVINQRAIIDRSKCIDCGKCVSVCPYKAIVRNLLPCEDACPVKAIGKDKDGLVEINFDRCIYCGKCSQACPFGAVMERSELVGILQAIKAGRQVIAMVAPSITSQFPGTIEQLFAALKTAGFSEIIEVALGAEQTTHHEAEEFFERMERGDKLMTSSCCPAWTETAKKHIPEILPMISCTPSPMAYTGRIAAEKFPGSIKVFIGPCIAKRNEARSDPNVDYVMSFELLGVLLAAQQIDIKSMPETALDHPAADYARNFAQSCGVTEALLQEIGGESRPKIKEKFINGLDAKAVSLLKIYSKGKMLENFIEVMACPGGCVNGPFSLAR